MQLHMRGQLRLVHAGRDRRAYDRRAVAVARIVLYDQYRTDTALLGTNHRAKIRIKNISSSNNHWVHTPITRFVISSISGRKIFYSAPEVGKERLVPG